jgi:hypothetical protein
MPNNFSDPYGSRKRVRLYIAIAAVILAAMFLHRHQLRISTGDLDISVGGGFGLHVCVTDWGCEVFRTTITEFQADPAPVACPETDDDNPTIEI